jgi:hypothetical protein
VASVIIHGAVEELVGVVDGGDANKLTVSLLTGFLKIHLSKTTFDPVILNVFVEFPLILKTQFRKRILFPDIVITVVED